MIDIIQQKELINLQVKYQQQQLIYSTLFSSANQWSIETNFNSSLSIKANQQKL